MLTCDNCVYFLKDSAKPLSDREVVYGSCQRFPPVFVNEANVFCPAGWSFPQVHSHTAACGEHQQFTTTEAMPVPGGSTGNPVDDLRRARAEGVFHTQQEKTASIRSFKFLVRMGISTIDGLKNLRPSDYADKRARTFGPGTHRFLAKWCRENYGIEIAPFPV